MAIRIEMLTPGPTIMDAMTYNRTFTLHGMIMIFLFMIPAIPAVFGNFMLPLMLGAKDVAFPRLNLASLYIYLAGAFLALWGMINGGLDTGWTFYTPYSTHTTTTVAPVLFGAFIIGFSSIATGLNFIVTMHTMRAPGITWFKLPLFVWAIYATSCIQVLATPVHWPAAGCRRREQCSTSACLIRRAAGTRCSSSTCSGSTATRPCTSWCCRPSA